MHVCYLCDEYPPRRGGIGTFTATLARAMVGRGHQATVVGLYDVPRETESRDGGVRVVRVPHGSLRGMNLIVNRRRMQQALRRLHRECAIDLLEGPENGFALSPRTAVAPRLIRMHGGHRFFTVTTGHQPRPWRSWLERRSFAMADHLCAVSHFVADTTRRLLDLGQRPVEVIANPVDVQRFRVRSDIPQVEGLLLFVGAVREKKGVLQLVQAMPEIVKRVPQARLMIVGPDVHEPRYGSFTAYLRSQVPPGLASRVEFRGPMAHGQLDALIASAHVCVYPSHSEAMPIAWLEAMASGKAVVVSGSGPGPELVDDGVSGLFCDPLRPASIAAAAIRILTDPGLALALGRAARRRAVERYSVDILAAQNEAFYQRCIAAGAHA